LDRQETRADLGWRTRPAFFLVGLRDYASHHSEDGTAAADAFLVTPRTVSEHLEE